MRAGFWQTVLGFVDVLRALVAVPLVIAGNSNVWFPGLINSHPPGNADRSCLELFRPILDAFNLEIQDPAAVPTHRHGADLDLIFASPVVAHHVEVHNGTYCPCEDRRTCCPLLGSDHFALPKQANIIKCKPLPSVHIDRAQIQSWSIRVQQVLREPPLLPFFLHAISPSQETSDLAYRCQSQQASRLGEEVNVF